MNITESVSFFKSWQIHPTTEVMGFLCLIFVKKDETTEWLDMSDADDFYTVVGKNFKYQIPFPYLMECNRIINEEFEKKIEYQKKRGVVETKDNLMHMIMGVGQFPYRYRKSILKNIISD